MKVWVVSSDIFNHWSIYSIVCLTIINACLKNDIIRLINSRNFRALIDSFGAAHPSGNQTNNWPSLWREWVELYLRNVEYWHAGFIAMGTNQIEEGFFHVRHFSLSQASIMTRSARDIHISYVDFHVFAISWDIHVLLYFSGWNLFPNESHLNTYGL